jgi:hypothetical protein
MTDILSSFTGGLILDGQKSVQLNQQYKKHPLAKN